MDNVTEFPEAKQGITMVTPEEAGVSKAKAEAINEDKSEQVSDSLIQEVFKVYEECDVDATTRVRHPNSNEVINGYIQSSTQR